MEWLRLEVLLAPRPEYYYIAKYISKYLQRLQNQGVSLFTAEVYDISNTLKKSTFNFWYPLGWLFYKDLVQIVDFSLPLDLWTWLCPVNGRMHTVTTSHILGWVVVELKLEQEKNNAKYLYIHKSIVDAVQNKHPEKKKPHPCNFSTALCKNLFFRFLARKSRSWGFI